MRGRLSERGARDERQACNCMEFRAVSTAVKRSIGPRGAWRDPCTLEVILHLAFSVGVLDCAEIVLKRYMRIDFDMHITGCLKS